MKAMSERQRIEHAVMRAQVFMLAVAATAVLTVFLVLNF